MALQTSGTITLNDIHEEANGTANSLCSINDSDIRALNEGSEKTINNTTNTTIDFEDFYGAATGSTGGGGDPGGGGGCLAYGTLVEMANGNFTPIEDIVVGDQVVSYNITGLGTQEDWYAWATRYRLFGEKTVSTVVANRLKTNGAYYLINESLKITNEHPVLIKRDNQISFELIESVNTGDNLLDRDLNWIQINSKVRVEEQINTGDLDVEEVDNYFAGGFLMHNAKGVITDKDDGFGGGFG